MSKKKRAIENEIGDFLRKYGRKKYPGKDPNDRAYDRKLENKIKQMDPEELDRLMHDGEDEEPAEKN